MNKPALMLLALLACRTGGGTSRPWPKYRLPAAAGSVVKYAFELR